MRLAHLSHHTVHRVMLLCMYARRVCASRLPICVQDRHLPALPACLAAAAAREAAAAAAGPDKAAAAGGAAGVSWRMRALQRAQQLAQEQGRGLNEVRGAGVV